MPPLLDLARIARRLVCEDPEREEAEYLCLRLYDLFVRTAPAAARAAVSEQCVDLPCGLALAPALAATCLLDAPRTQAFARGAMRAIETVRERTAIRPLEVLYAGSGPFAPLAALLLPLLAHEQVTFTIIDIHDDSVSSVSELMAAFGFQARTTVLCADASTYKHGRDLHVVISETLQRGLNKEPLVSIRRNLQPQIAFGGVFVPHRVWVDLELLDCDTELNPGGRGLHAGTSRLVARIVELDDSGLTIMNEVVTIPAFGNDRFRLALATTVHVYDKCYVPRSTSGLTTPEILWNVPSATSDVQLKFKYRLDPKPRLEWTISPVAVSA